MQKENGTAVFRSINRLKAALIETGISLTDAVVTKTHIMIRAKNPIFVYLKDKEAHWFVVVNGVEVHSKTVKLLRQYLTNS